MSNLASFFAATPASITTKVFAKATIHKTHVEVYQPKVPFDKMEEGWESSKPLNRTHKSSSSDESNLERSLRRTRKTVKDLCLNNDFNQWVTLTNSTERNDDTLTLQKLRVWLKAQKKKYGHFHYVLVPERHKDGALHFHGLFGGYSGPTKPAINNKVGSRYYGTELKKNGRTGSNLVDYDLGYSYVENIDSLTKISNYITKYITKDIAQLGKSKKRYWASKGLDKPAVEYNPQWFTYFDHNVTQLHEFENEHGTSYYLPLKSMNILASLSRILGNPR